MDLGNRVTRAIALGIAAAAVVLPGARAQAEELSVTQVTDAVQVSYYANMAALGELVFFAGYDPEHHSELWASDGTEAGTYLVEDIVPGSGGASPGHFTPMGDRMYFTAQYWNENGAFRNDLMATDGTADGTVLVKSLNNSSANLTPMGERLFFTLPSSSGNHALWKSDGTATGTYKVMDIDVVSNTMAAPPGGRLYFTADDGVHGSELWSSDGTVAGTTMVADAAPGPAGSDPTAVTAAGGTLYFTAHDAENGRELWTTDGTPSGTSLVTDLTPGSASTPIGAMAALDGNRVMFANDGDLWRSDGTPAGTVQVKSVPSSRPDNFETYADPELTELDGELYYTTPLELWRTDGTTAGTVPIYDLTEHANCVSNPWETCPRVIEQTRAVGDRLYLEIDLDWSGAELWTSDGTTAGTTILADIKPGRLSGNPTMPVELGDGVVFSAQDSTARQTLWRAVPTTPTPTETCQGLTATIIGSGSITGTSGADVIVGSDGADSIYGAGGDDVICARGGDDVITGGAGDDQEYGGSGDDKFWQASINGADVMVGGDGRDTVNYTKRSSSVQITLWSSSTADDGAPDEGDNVRGIEVAIGGAGADRIIGSAGDELLIGGMGDDRIGGGSGRDRVEGRSGNDTLWLLDELVDIGDGGTGTDTVRADPNDSIVNVP